MRILMAVHHDLDRHSGAAGASCQLADEYRRLGHEAEFYSFADLPAAIPNKLRPLIFPWFLTRRLLEMTRDGGLDVVEASTGDGWIFSRLPRRSHRPLMVTRSYGLEHTLHQTFLREAARGRVRQPSWRYRLYYGRYRLWEVQSSLRRADLSLLVSRHDYRYARDILRVPEHRLEVVHHGIPDSFAQLALAPTPIEPATPIRIAMIAAYIWRKGVQDAARALNPILAQFPTTTVAFLGTLRSRAEVLRDYEPVFHPRIAVVPRYHREQLPALLSSYHIKVLATLYEGFSLALVEAMACGLAPVVTDAPGASEFIRNGESGLVFGAGDSDGLYRALSQLIQDRAKLDRIRRNAQADAQRFLWSEIARQTTALYNERLKALASTASRARSDAWAHPRGEKP